MEPSINCVAPMDQLKLKIDRSNENIGIYQKLNDVYLRLCCKLNKLKNSASKLTRIAPHCFAVVIPNVYGCFV